jgi:hypothetical protein
MNTLRFTGIVEDLEVAAATLGHRCCLGTGYVFPAGVKRLLASRSWSFS